MWNKKKITFSIKKNISYLWCLSKYPCEPNDLKNLPKNFQKSKFDGYSDHSIGIEARLIAISRESKNYRKTLYFR